jgi:uncharacterized protein
MRVKELVVYPVKGCRGLSVTSAVLESTGLLLDRQFCLVREGSDKFLAARHQPKLLLVSCRLLDNDGNEVTALTETPAVLECSCESQAPLRLYLARPAQEATPQVAITVWEWSGFGSDCGHEAAGAQPTADLRS